MSKKDSEVGDMMSSTDLITLSRHLIYQQKKHTQATGDFTLLLTSICLGCKFVSSAVRKAGLANMTGLAGAQNVQGEDQKKLDVIADAVFVNSLRSCGRVASMVTEEQEEAIIVREAKSGAYTVVFDPLDGSSNIDCGVSIGTIFGIYKSDHPTFSEADALKPGREMVAAGYAMYGSSTSLVLSWGQGVNSYALDPALGEFILTHENLQLPPKASIYSINEGNYQSWNEATKEFVEGCKNPKDGSKPYSARYIGSMVADIHRTLLYGGIFMYPADKKSPDGKLRLLYECFPMAFLVEQAGGKATTGSKRILDIQPPNIHGRAPIYLGCKEDVEAIEALYKKHNIE
ncbi:fructose-1,6-bisphosphatase, cytosolic [Sphaeroforma arctica JP610]|uniref:Fructose-1,6-bisphosphatase, cytosolic n=1 Tax=Sphaeroforma arctica JP610 TaxID=667725 RepID=A0A0L0GCV5_9EUKA|nr:fructose-1,6-bisphosphatase, cytosolic [Sphaeroforma arctica JP610]KNC86721.1 fructose-1,6-bisphosphatase, cytosolic [Sphaeroforma arctica JP610]|eukprot:XP_014160623.1 fructose-1,6-bisphosphatase, cytosolic [Sphaeroforma arctica JP610]